MMKYDINLDFFRDYHPEHKTFDQSDRKRK